MLSAEGAPSDLPEAPERSNDAAPAADSHSRGAVFAPHRLDCDSPSRRLPLKGGVMLGLNKAPGDLKKDRNIDRQDRLKRIETSSPAIHPIDPVYR